MYQCSDVESQLISYVINHHSLDFWDDNGIDESFFFDHPRTYEFIRGYYDEYNTTPTEETLNHFLNQESIKDVESIRLYENTDNERNLIECAKDNRAFLRFQKNVVPEANRLMMDDAWEAMEYMQSQIAALLKDKKDDKVISINREAFKRFETYKERCNSDTPYMYGTGFKELDDLIGGLRKSEELCVIYARTGNCKTWVLNRIMQYNWHLGRNVGIFSPEMSADTLGRRFDTLEGHFDNYGITSGRHITNEDAYKEYAIAMSAKNGAEYKYCNPATFGHKCTVSKLRRFVEQNDIEILGIDGISYIQDERYQKGDSITTRLTHIAEDLMSMSMELQIPIVVVAQANRTGVSEDTPELDSIRDSDGISHNSTLAISVRMKDDILTMKITKARYSKIGEKLRYKCDLNYGQFEAQMLETGMSFDDLEVKNRGVVNKQPLTRKFSSTPF